MICAWESYLSVLPAWLRYEVDRQGKNDLQQLRLRLGMCAQMCMDITRTIPDRLVQQEDLDFVIQTASRYSPWSAASISQGYLTVQGGHRIGVCGEAVIHNGVMSGMRNITSICIRTARQFPGIADAAAQYTGSVLIIGRPGSGKTTLLRELIRLRSGKRKGSVAVIDERSELFPMVNGKYCFERGPSTDVLLGCSKSVGISCVLRTMGPSCIAVDEITAEEDCAALMNAAWNGVDLLATAHAADLSDLRRRPVYRRLMEMGLFDWVLVMRPDQSWFGERMCVCT